MLSKKHIEYENNRTYQWSWWIISHCICSILGIWKFMVWTFENFAKPSHSENCYWQVAKEAFSCIKNSMKQETEKDNGSAIYHWLQCVCFTIRFSFSHCIIINDMKRKTHNLSTRCLSYLFMSRYVIRLIHSKKVYNIPQLKLSKINKNIFFVI